MESNTIYVYSLRFWPKAFELIEAHYSEKFLPYSQILNLGGRIQYRRRDICETGHLYVHLCNQSPLKASGIPKLGVPFLQLKI